MLCSRTRAHANSRSTMWLLLSNAIRRRRAFMFVHTSSFVELYSTIYPTCTVLMTELHVLNTYLIVNFPMLYFFSGRYFFIWPNVFQPGCEYGVHKDFRQVFTIRFYCTDTSSVQNSTLKCLLLLHLDRLSCIIQYFIAGARQLGVGRWLHDEPGRPPADRQREQN